MNVTRDAQRYSRRTFGHRSEPTRSYVHNYSTSLRARPAHSGRLELGRVINGLFGTVDEAAS